MEKQKLHKQPKKHKKNKGSFVSDANANRDYVGIARKAGWTEIHVPSGPTHEKIPDPIIASVYAKGIHPIFTSDKSAYKLTSGERKKSGYIIHKVVKTGEEDKRYKEQVRKFFTKYSESATHKMRWTIELDGEAMSVSISNQ